MFVPQKYLKTCTLACIELQLFLSINFFTVLSLFPVLDSETGGKCNWEGALHGNETKQNKDKN